MITRTVYLLCVYCILCNASSAQHYFYDNRYYDSDILFDISFSSGIINGLTDIGGKKGVGRNFIKDLNWGNTRISGGVTASVVYRSVVALRLQFNAGSITAYDSILKNDLSDARSRYNRNLHFKTSITELLCMAELYPCMLWEQEDNTYRMFSPYITAGIGVFHFNPKAKLNGVWIALHKLHTEGQGFKEYADRDVYKLTQFNFPMGIGIKVDLSALWNLRLELIHRITATDYIDDVSTRYIDPSLFQQYLSPSDASLALQLHDRQKELDPAHVTLPGSIRGNNKKNDAYFTVQLKFGLILGREKR